MNTTDVGKFSGFPDGYSGLTEDQLRNAGRSPVLVAELVADDVTEVACKASRDCAGRRATLSWQGGNNRLGSSIAELTSPGEKAVFSARGVRGVPLATASIPERNIA